MIKILIKKKKKLKEIEVPSDIKKDQYKDFVLDWKNLGKILIKYSNNFSKNGINVMGAKRLGSGSFGVAYLLNDGKVLKLTKDTEEAIISNFLINKSIQHFVKIFGVFKLPITDTGEQIYAILQEKLMPVSKQDGSLLEKNIKVLKQVIGGSDPFIFTNKKWEEIKSLKQVQNKPDVLNYLEEIGFNNICNDLNKSGIKFVDFHSGNFMRRSDGTLVLIDIGADATNFGSESNIKQI